PPPVGAAFQPRSNGAFQPRSNQAFQPRSNRAVRPRSNPPFLPPSFPRLVLRLLPARAGARPRVLAVAGRAVARRPLLPRLHDAVDHPAAPLTRRHGGSAIRRRGRASPDPRRPRPRRS